MSGASYRERASAAGLAGHVESLWCQEVPPGTEPHAQRVLPDGCTDLLWREGRLCVAGPDTAWRVEPLPPGSFAVGVRFRTGLAGPLFGGVPLGEWRDTEIDLAELWGAGAARRLSERLGEAGRPREVARLMEDALMQRLAAHGDFDPVVRAAVGTLAARRPPSVSALADRFGLSERQLHRRFTGAVGYGPKTLAGVLRLHRALRLARTANPAPDGRAPRRPGLADVALAAGYADQPHMTREVRRLTGLPPGVLLAGGRVTRAHAQGVNGRPPPCR